jgi:hypothetical protein
MRIRDPGWKICIRDGKIRILGKHPGSATLDGTCAAKDGLVFDCPHLLSYRRFSRIALSSLFKERKVG